MWFSGSAENVHTLVADFLECTEITFGQISFPGREGTLFQGNSLITGFNQCTLGDKRGSIIEDEMGLICA